tara:strand:- start:239 stop:1984 length:1746 start_codon:yes stop_codon:yes gene_type:complete
MDNILPFTAIVGMELVKKSLLYHAVYPRLGGLILIGHRGCAKSTLARAFKSILPTTNGSNKIPFVEVPLGTTEDRLLGSIDASKLLKKGEWSPKVGLIQKANGGVLYIDEINLLQDHLVDSLLDSSTSGQHIIEREGISQTVSASYILIGSMNPEEGDLRPQLTDRFTHGIFVRDEFNVNQRKEIVRTRMEFDDDPKSFIASHREKIDQIKKQIFEARKKLNEVKISENFRNEVAEKATFLNLEGVRAELGVLRTARCAAAWRGSKEVSANDIEEAWELCLAHRKDNFSHKKQNTNTEKKFGEDLSNKKDTEYSQNQKTSISPVITREDKIFINTTQNLKNMDLLSWWMMSNKKIKKVLNSFVFRSSTHVQEQIHSSKISWYASFYVSILNGWIPGKPLNLRYSKPMRRKNFWIFFDASRSTGVVNFLGKALEAINNLGSKTLNSRFYVLVLQNSELSWWVKRGTIKKYRESLKKLNEASGKSNLTLALEKLNTAVKKNGFLYGDRILLCSDGMFSKENEKSINDSKKRFRIVLKNLTEKVTNLGWLYPNMRHGMRHWLPDLTRGIDVRLISLKDDEGKNK